MRPDKKTISLLKNNLVEVVKKVNHYHNEIWFRIFPPEGLNKDYFKKTKPAFIKEIGQSPEFALYIHIPFCKNRCDYCSLRGGCDIKKVGTFNYVNCLKLELGQMLEKRKDRKILSILIGGGTPSLLEAEDINCLIKYLRKNFTIGPKAQICMEAAPSDISRKMARAIVENGINRICLGVQSFNQKKLRQSNRLYQDKADVYRAVKNLRAAGHNNISFDLIYGLEQGETAQDFLKDNLSDIAKLSPDNIDVYSLVNYRKYPESIYNFPSNNIKEINRRISSVLEKNNPSRQSQLYDKSPSEKYNEKELPLGDSSYYFLRRILLKDVEAVGLGAKGDFWRDGQYIMKYSRYNQSRDFEGYQKAIKKRQPDYSYYNLSKEDSLRKYIIFTLNRYGVYESVIEEKFNQTKNVFNDIMSKAKGIAYSNGVFYLEKNYQKFLPFKTNNDQVNYFIYCFYYLYSDKDREKIIRTIL